MRNIKFAGTFELLEFTLPMIRPSVTTCLEFCSSFINFTKKEKMTDLQLYTKISSLPNNLKLEVIDFVDFLKSKKKSSKSIFKKKRVFGYAKDSITIKPSFDEPLDDFKEYM